MYAMPLVHAAAAIAVAGDAPVGIPFTILEGQTGILLDIDWSGYAPGVYRVTVTLDGFDDPVTFDVTILASVAITTTLGTASPTVGVPFSVTYTLDQVYGVDVEITPSFTGADIEFADETVIIPAGQLSAFTMATATEAGEGTIGGTDTEGMTGPNSVPFEAAEPIQITPADATHAHSATSPTLAAKATIIVTDALHAHISTSPTITPDTILVVPADATHAHGATSPSLAAKSHISPADSTHGLTSTSPTLVTKSTVVPHDAFHAMMSTRASLRDPSVPTTSSDGLWVHPSLFIASRRRRR